MNILETMRLLLRALCFPPDPPGAPRNRPGMLGSTENDDFRPDKNSAETALMVYIFSDYDVSRVCMIQGT